MPLASWRDGATKQRILDFVKAVTTSGPQFVTPAERIATFDLDGTLWTEQPMYAQAQFAIDFFFGRHAGMYGGIGSLLQRVRDGLADPHQSFATVADLIRSPLTTEQYRQAVQEWLRVASHPCFDRPYADLVYQPMRELLDYFQANDFRVYIVSGGGVEFLRAFCDDVFRIPPEQVIGSSVKTEFVADPDGSNAVIRLTPWPDLIDNGKRKAESINEFIGRRPIAAFGNSDGDQQMLEWAAAGDGARLMLLVHHTDALREYGYDANAHFGRLDLALVEATARGWDSVNNRGWIIADIERDWETIYAFGPVTRNNSASCRPR